MTGEAKLARKVSPGWLTSELTDSVNLMFNRVPFGTVTRSGGTGIDAGSVESADLLEGAAEGFVVDAREFEAMTSPEIDTGGSVLKTEPTT